MPTAYRQIMAQIKLYGPQEVRKRLGVTRAQLLTLMTKEGFPRPLDTIAAGAIWRASDIDRWAEANGYPM